MNSTKWLWSIPVAVGLAGMFAVALWTRPSSSPSLALRLPGADASPGETGPGTGNPVLRGETLQGPGQPATLQGAWPQFRGAARDGIGHGSPALAHEWGPSGPRRLWTTEVGEGYAGPAVSAGRVYLMDYDRERQRDALRCLSLEDGREIWRFSYPVTVKRNHGMSRTVPTIVSNLVVSMGPKCHVSCVDATTGRFVWGLDLVKDFGATVPPWYAGQCPLVDGDKVVLAPGGRDALLIAVELSTGRLLWKSPNPSGWKMTHSSIVMGEAGGRRFYTYCGSGGVAGISPEDGSILWQTPEWKISIAMVPSPVPLPEGRLFLSGGYNAGSLMLRLQPEGNVLRPVTEYRLKPEVFGATQHTPVAYQGHLFGIRADPDDDLVCLTLAGKVVWGSGDLRFGLGPFLIADGLIFAADDSGKLCVFEANTSAARLLSQAQVLEGRETWAPMALAHGRLLVRDLTRLICLDVAAGR